MKKLLSIDTCNQSFSHLGVTKVDENNEGMIEIYYTWKNTQGEECGCVSPMLLDWESYKQLVDGHIVELHHGEVALLKID